MFRHTEGTYVVFTFNPIVEAAVISDSEGSRGIDRVLIELGDGTRIEVQNQEVTNKNLWLKNHPEGQEHWSKYFRAQIEEVRSKVSQKGTKEN